jgi:hypothetical protein
MELLNNLLMIFFAKDLIYFTIQIVLSVIYLFQLIHAADNPIVRQIATDRIGFVLVLSVMFACFLHHLWLLSLSSKSVVLGTIGAVIWMWRS